MSRFLADITPLKVSPAYRRLWIGNSISAVGVQVTLTAVSLQVYDLTASSLYVGLVGLFALVPLVIAGLYGGSIADNYDRRKVALISGFALWASAAGIAAQAWLELGNVWVLYGLIAAHSAAQGVNQPTRSAMIPALVGRELLPAANALNMLTMSIAMMAGPLLAGTLVVTVGFAWTYTIEVLTFLAALWALWLLPSLPPGKAEDDEALSRRAGLRSVLEGFKFLSTRKNVRMTFLIDINAMVMAAPRAVLPAIGAIMIGGGELTVGILMAAMAAGAFFTGLFSGPLTRIHRHGAAIFWAVVAYGLAITGFGVVVLFASGHPVPGDGSLTWWVWPAAVFMMMAGSADSVSAIFRSTVLQSATPDHMRGRLQGVFIVVVAGGPRVGDMVSGSVGEAIGEHWTMIIGGIACAVVAALMMRWLPGFMRYDSRKPIP
ncbi:MFS transporter [Nesterenkonia sp. MY13]|uniref:MFS transporter n=1 Tax=Nesterenkonia sedimenti TaxID=1463632 RepID=A0A7X8TJU8_9MICC|nr:MFS transporter [Nesterenkonia sedimenti]NLS10145.1 MFS transporter [Nesterenkonia sedimenti]